MSDQKYKLTYFALWAKGPAPALALAFSGLDWIGDDAGTGANMEGYEAGWAGKNKAKAAWKCLPNLVVPGNDMTIGHEGAILNFIGRKVPSMAGETDTDFAASQQLFFVGEDIFQKLGQLVDTPFLKKGKGDDAFWKISLDAFWGNAEENTHNTLFGVKVYLKQLDDYYKKCGNGIEGGKFTSTGTTIGECKLFSTLHACVMCKGEELLKDFPCVLSFYKRFLNERETQAIIADGGNYPHKFSQYFL